MLYMQREQQTRKRIHKSLTLWQSSRDFSLISAHTKVALCTLISLLSGLSGSAAVYVCTDSAVPLVY